MTNASRTLVMNLESLDWDDELLEGMRVPLMMLSAIVSSSDPNPWGSTTADGPFAERIPVCGALGDQQSATVGQACYDVSDANSTYGTESFLILNTGPDLVQSTKACYQQWPIG